MKPSSLAVGALFLCAAVSSLVTGQGPNSPIDLAVRLESIPPGEPLPEWRFGAPNTTGIYVTIQNQGEASVGYHLAYQWIGPDGAAPLNGNATDSFDASDSPLAAGQERQQPRFPWRLQPGQIGAGQLRVTVTPAGTSGVDRDPSDNVRNLPLFLKSHRAALNIPGAEQRIRPDETIFFRLHFPNEGNNPASVRLSTCPGSDPSLQRLQVSISPPQLTADPGQRAEATVFISLPFDGDTSPVQGMVCMRGSTSFGALLTAQSPMVRSSTQPYGDGYGWDVVRTDKASPFVAYDTPTLLTFQIRNTGAHPDVYDIIPHPDSHLLAEASPPRLGLDPSEAKSITLRIHPTDEAPPGTRADLGLEVRSVHGKSPSLQTVQFRTFGPALELVQAATDTPMLYRNEASVWKVRLANHGNQDEASPGALSLALQTPKRQAAHTMTLPPLGAQSSADFDVTLAGIDEGGSATLQVRWEPDDEAIAVQEIRKTVNLHDPILQLSTPGGVVGAPGQQVDYFLPPQAFEIRNLGNDTETFLLSVAATSGIASLPSGARMELLPGQSRIVPVTHLLPLPAANLTHDNVSLTVRTGNEKQFQWTASARTGIRDAQAPSVAIEDVPPVWEVSRPFPLSVLATDDTAVARVEVKLVLPTGQGSAMPLKRTDGSHWTGSLTFPGPGVYELRAEAFDKAGKNATHSARLEARPVAPPSLSFRDSIAPSLQAGAKVRVLVSDPLPIAYVVARLMGNPEEADLPIALRPENETWVLVLPSLTPGNYSATIEAANMAGAQSQLAWSFEIPAIAQPKEEGAGTEGPAGAAPGLSGALAAAIGLVVAFMRIRKPRTPDR